MEASDSPPSDPNHQALYRCEVCAASFSNEGTLRSHQKLQHGDAPDSFELRAPMVPRVPRARPLDWFAPPGVRDGRDADGPTPQSDRRYAVETAEPEGTKVDENLLPQEDRDPVRAGTEKELATPFTPYSEFVRSNGRRLWRRRSSGRQIARS